MKEQTDTHRRCDKCREWKWRHHFPMNKKWLAWECRECKRKRMAMWQYKKSEDYIRARYQQTMEGTSRRRRQAMDERAEAAKTYITLLRSRGWTLSRIARESGLCRNTVMWAARQEKKFIYPDTVQKLRDAFMREVAQG